MLPRVIVEPTLDAAWYQAIKTPFILDTNQFSTTFNTPLYCKKYLVDKGSFEGGQVRYQVRSLTVIVTNPETRPLAPIVPEGQTPPTTDDYIEQYFAEYIMNPEKAPNEEYSYGEFIYPHLESIIKMLTDTPATNQAVINIGGAFEYWIASPDTWPTIEKYPQYYINPPCLRCITWQYEDGKLHISTFWRSWDLFAGMPTNLGGLQLLNEYVASECGYETGTLTAYSSGAHIYDNCKELAEARFGKKLSW